MPSELQSELVILQPPQTVSFELEPAHNLLHSLLLLNASDHYSGLNEWVGRTWESMSPERRHNNRLVLEGLHYAIVPVRSWASFEDYVNDLAATDPVTLRDRLLTRLVSANPVRVTPDAPRFVPFNPRKLLDKETYIEFLLRYFGDTHLDLELEREAHDYFTDPPRMHALIVYHMQTMWREVLRPEWNRVRPMLEEAVQAFSAPEHARLSAVEAVRQVSRQELNPHFEEMLQAARNLILVPSAHVGPYLGKFTFGETMWVIFGAHTPDGARAPFSALGRSEILTRLAALNDDTRLRILELLAKQGELCAQELISLLDLSQPAASRHLKQLSATGYVIERRREGNKCYTLNADRMDETFAMLNRFLNRD